MTKEDYEKAKKMEERMTQIKELAKRESERMGGEHRSEVKALLKGGMQPPGPVNR